MAERRNPKPNRIAPLLTRRAFVRQVGGTALLATGVGVGGWLAYSDEPMRRGREEILKLKDFRVAENPLYPRLALVHGQNLEAMTRAALDALGGVNRFIAKGDRVLLKPNVGWDRQPEQAANTGPELVAAMVRLCREAGAAKVWVSDVSLNDPLRCFARSGIEAATQAAGGEIRIPGAADFVKTDMGGQLLKVWPVSRFFHEADKVINLPIVKHHSLSGATIAMKNWYGIIGGRRNQLHQDIHASIVDLASALRPTLTVLDATRILKRNGPTGGSLADVATGDAILAGVDEVAMDSWALGLLDLTPERIPYLALGEARGLGKVDWRALRLAETQVG